MNKKETLKKLRGMDLGGVFWVNGRPFVVDEVVFYQEEKEKWLDFVDCQQGGLESVIEIERQELSLWLQVIDVKLIRKKTVGYRAETYRLDEEESGEAETILRKMENGKEVSKSAMTPYDIFVAPSGRRLCREIWDGKECWYLSEPGKITISF